MLSGLAAATRAMSDGGAGRPTLQEEDGMLRVGGSRELVVRAVALMCDGLDTAEIARRLRISEAVVYRWWIVERDRQHRGNAR